MSIHLAIDASNIRMGGGVTHLSQLLHHADPSEFDISQVTIWTTQKSAQVFPSRPWLRVRRSAWIESSYAKRILGQQYFLPKEVIAEGCNVLFSPGGITPKNCNFQTITMSQNMLPFEPLESAQFGTLSPTNLKMKLLKYSQSKSLRTSNGVIFLTKYAQTAIIKSLGGLSSSQIVIPHGVESRFRNRPRDQFPISQYSKLDPFKILYVSITMPYKHQIEVAYAASVLRAQGLPLEVRFIGTPWGAYGQKFTKILNQLDPNRDYLLWDGEESFERIHEFYCNTEAFIFASSCENLPNILLEAMAAGIPVACSDRGAIPEILRDAGIYFDPYSVQSVSCALMTLCVDHELHALNAQKAWIKSNDYSWETCARMTFQFISEVAGSFSKNCRTPLSD